MCEKLKLEDPKRTKRIFVINKDIFSHNTLQFNTSISEKRSTPINKLESYP